MTRRALPRPATNADDERRCRELVARSRELVFREPREALAAAVAATEAAADLTAAPDDAAALADLRAEAWAYRGNAQRVLTDLDAAEACFRRAEDELSDGSGDPSLTARLLDLHASLWAARGRGDEAAGLLDRALELCGDERSVLRAHLLVNKGYVLLQAGREATALPVLREALALLRPENELRLFLFAAGNLIKALHLVGYSIAARSLIAELRPLHDRLGDRISLLRLDWLEAQIDAELGAAARAEAKLRQVRDDLVEAGLAYDAALVSLDLANLLARDHRFVEIRQLALEMFPIFQSRRIHREALAALILFRESISGGRADLTFIAEVRTFLEKARQDTRLRFRSPR